MVAAWISAENRRRAFHGIRQPGVQQELGRLGHRAHEQQQAGQRQRVDISSEESRSAVSRRTRKDGLEVGRPISMKIAKIRAAKPKSPNRLTTKALIAAAFADGFWYQNPISR